MAKRNRTKGQTTIYKTLHRKQTKDRATRNSLKKPRELRCFGRVSRFYSNSDIRRVTVKRHEHHLIIASPVVLLLNDTNIFW